ncbi:MAG: metal-dependent hydrolase [Novosphingobium sp.]
MSLTVRKPDIARSDADVNWSPVPEFAHVLNGASVVIPYVEHYLNNVMSEVRRDCCAHDPALAEEIALFIRQEATHSRYHMAFNKLMFDSGYDGLQAVIDRTVADLQRQRAGRSLAFNVAYCAGFETTATFSACYLLEHCDAMFKGGDAYGANLLQWHVAEEFEHRTTCHRALHAVGGGYLLRIAGFLYSFWHINVLFSAAEAVILDKYRAGMSAAQVKASRRVVSRIKRRQLLHMLPGLVRLVMPGYDPARIAVPEKVRKALDFFRGTGPIVASFADLRDTPG